MSTAQELAEQIRLLGQQRIERQWALGTVDAGHTTGNPRVIFDGETVSGPKPYPRLQNVRAGDRVVLTAAGSTWVVVGTLGTFDVGWVTAVLGANVVAYNAVADFGTPGYRKDENGWVHLRGLVQGTGLVAGATVFTLPVGYRPGVTLINSVVAADAFCRLDVLGLTSTAPGAVVARAGVSTSYTSLVIPPFLAEG